MNILNKVVVNNIFQLWNICIGKIQNIINFNEKSYIRYIVLFSQKYDVSKIELDVQKWLFQLHTNTKHAKNIFLVTLHVFKNFKFFVESHDFDDFSKDPNFLRFCQCPLKNWEQCRRSPCRWSLFTLPLTLLLKDSVRSFFNFSGYIGKNMSKSKFWHGIQPNCHFSKFWQSHTPKCDEF